MTTEELQRLDDLDRAAGRSVIAEINDKVVQFLREQVSKDELNLETILGADSGQLELNSQAMNQLIEGLSQITLPPSWMESAHEILTETKRMFKLEEPNNETLTELIRQVAVSPEFRKRYHTVWKNKRLIQEVFPLWKPHIDIRMAGRPIGKFKHEFESAVSKILTDAVENGEQWAYLSEDDVINSFKFIIDEIVRKDEEKYDAWREQNVLATNDQIKKSNSLANKNTTDLILPVNELQLKVFMIGRMPTRIYSTLSNYISKDQHDALEELMGKGSIENKIWVKLSAGSFAYVFKQAMEAKDSQILAEMKELSKWLATNFSCGKKSPKVVSYGYTYNILRNNKKVKKNNQILLKQ